MVEIDLEVALGLCRPMPVEQRTRPSPEGVQLKLSIWIARRRHETQL